MVKKIGVLVQAHMGSTRLPKKMIKDLFGQPVLWHIIQRLKNIQEADEIIIATSDKPDDDVLVDICQKENMPYFRGSDDDVLSRFYHAATQFHLTDVARVCADNLLLDWKIIDDVIKTYRQSTYDVVLPEKGVPLGFACDVFPYELLKQAFENGKEHYHREHVTPYIYEHTKNIYRTPFPHDYSRYRFTLDTERDWQLIQKIYNVLYLKNKRHDFCTDEVIALMEKNPEWFFINSDVHQKTIYE